MENDKPKVSKQNIIDLQRKIAEMRATARDYNDVLQPKQAALNEAIEAMQNEYLLENSEAVQAKFAAETDALNLEKTLRNLLIDFYKETGDKSPLPGFGVRCSVQLIYSDAKAFEWANQHDLALMLDKKAFEQICKTPLKPDFVKTDEKITATISGAAFGGVGDVEVIGRAVDTRGGGAGESGNAPPRFNNGIAAACGWQPETGDTPAETADKHSALYAACGVTADERRRAIENDNARNPGDESASAETENPRNPETESDFTANPNIDDEVF